MYFLSQNTITIIIGNTLKEAAFQVKLKTIILFSKKFARLNCSVHSTPKLHPLP